MIQSSAKESDRSDPERPRARGFGTLIAHRRQDLDSERFFPLP